MPSTETPNVSATREAVGVVIVSWNVKDLLLACLESLSNSPRPLRIVVVDNASSDGSSAAVASQYPVVEIIANDSNRGFTRATNQGLRLLGALPNPAPDVRVERLDGGDEEARPATSAGSISGVGFAVLLNPDTEVVGEAIGKLADYLSAHPAVGAAGPGLVWPDGSPQSSRRRFPTLATGLFESTPLAWHWPGNPEERRFKMQDAAETEGAVDWVTGAALAVRTAALKDVGGLDEGFFMYSEELDLCRRLADAGWATHYVPSATVIHHEGKSSDQAVLARHLQFQRSRVRYFHKHHGGPQAAIVRAAILLGYVFEAAAETLKLAVGHQPTLRRQRLATYRAILADGLAPALPEAPGRGPDPTS